MENNKQAILLTGASGGVGFEVAKKFIAEGYVVFGLDVKEPGEQFDGFNFIKTDLTKSEDVESAFNKVKESGYRLKAIINTAGRYDLNSLIEISEEEFIKIFNINVFSIYRTNKAFLPLLEKKGKIIMISSELGPLDPLPFTGLYAITKSTIEKYAYSLRMELQLLDYQVVVIRPGAINTGLLEVSMDRLNSFTENTKYYTTNSQKFKKIVSSVENKKVPPQKISNLIYKVNEKKKPKYVYNINRNFSLRILNILPKRLQNYIIKQILKAK